jgi:hypothetical protein
MCGNSAYCWNTVLTGRLNGGSAATSAPSIRICPSVARSKPAISLRVVVLPDPDAPRTVRNSPVSTASEMPSSAVNAPNR